MEKETKTNKKGTTSAKKTTTKKAIPKKVETKKQDNVKKVETKKVNKNINKVDAEKVKAATKKNKVYYANSEATEIGKFFIIIFVIVLVVGAVYLCTRAFVTKDLFTKKEEKTEERTPGSVNYDIAIMGNMLNKAEDEYYVVIYNMKDGEYISDMSTLVYLYNSLEKHQHLYQVDLSNPMNSEYYDPENENVNAKSLSEIKVGDITLIKVKKDKAGNNTINKYIVDYSKMVDELGVKLS